MDDKNTQDKINEEITRYGLVKIPVTEKTDGKESVYRRVGKFLLLVGVEEAAKIIPHLSQEQTEKIIPEIASIRNIDPEEATVILAEFNNLVEKSREQGGVSTVRNILEKAYGSEKAQDMIKKVVPYPEGVPFEYLQEMDAENIFILLKDEGIPVKTMILSRLKPKIAAGVINMMDNLEKKEIIIRLSKITPVDKSIVKRVDQSIHEKLLSINKNKVDKVDGRNLLAQILKRMDPSAENTILHNLAETDVDLSNKLRESLFTIEDFINADDLFIQNYLRKMSDIDIAILIMGKREEFRQKVLYNLSKTRGDQVLEEEVLKGSVSKQESEQITSLFITSMRRAWESGELFVRGRNEDQYIL